MKKAQYNIDPKLLDDFVSVIVLGIILGGRIGHVLFYDFGYYSQNPLEIIKILVLIFGWPSSWIGNSGNNSVKL